MSVATWLQVSGTTTRWFENTTLPSGFRISETRVAKAMPS
jgi:hypothetical protein